jgi:hypothetical protein
MVDFDPAFLHDLLQVTVRNRISDIEEHSVQDDRSGIVAAFEINRHVLILTHEFKRRRLTQAGQVAHIPKIRDRTASTLSIFGCLLPLINLSTSYKNRPNLPCPAIDNKHVCAIAFSKVAAVR